MFKISVALLGASVALAAECDPVKGLIDNGLGSCDCINSLQFLNDEETECVSLEEEEIHAPLLYKSGRRLADSVYVVSLK